MEVLLKPGMLFVVAIVGAFVHFLKKEVREESFVGIRNYFATHFRSTVIALIATLVSTAGYLLTLQTGQSADFLVVFSLGYLSDSLFNKWDTQ